MPQPTLVSSQRIESEKVAVSYWTPPDSLNRYFGASYCFSTSLPEYQDLTRADMPQLRFMLEGSGYYRFHGGRSAATPAVALVGPTMGATEFFLDAPTRVIGVSVLPLGWHVLSCGEASDHTDYVRDMVELGGNVFAELLENLRGLSDEASLVQCLWDFLDRTISPPPEEVEEMVAKIDRWLSETRAPQIEDLQALTGLSLRQAARYTNRLYGAAPKLLARKYRALRCAAQIVIDHKNWQDLCEDGTFYDQAHFIREIKQFVGMTPHRLLNSPSEVARATVQRRALTGLSSEVHRLS